MRRACIAIKPRVVHEEVRHALANVVITTRRRHHGSGLLRVIHAPITCPLSRQSPSLSAEAIRTRAVRRGPAGAGRRSGRAEWIARRAGACKARAGAQVLIHRTGSWRIRNARRSSQRPLTA